MTNKELRRRYHRQQLMYDNPMETMVDVLMRFEKNEEKNRILYDSVTLLEAAVMALLIMVIVIAQGDITILFSVGILASVLGYNIYDRNQQMKDLDKSEDE